MSIVCDRKAAGRTFVEVPSLYRSNFRFAIISLWSRLKGWHHTNWWIHYRSDCCSPLGRQWNVLTSHPFISLTGLCKISWNWSRQSSIEVITQFQCFCFAILSAVVSSQNCNMLSSDSSLMEIQAFLFEKSPFFLPWFGHRAARWNSVNWVSWCPLPGYHSMVAPLTG